MSLTTGCNVPFKVKSKFFCNFIFVDVFVTTFTCTYYFFHEASVPSVFNGIVGRVRNGFDTEEPLPYQLARSPGGCGAILISSRFAITANHCGWYVPWDSMAFVAGKYYKNMKPSDKNVQKRRVKKVYGNRPKNLEWHPDLVVVEFEEPFNMVPGVIEPACLPTQKIDLGTKCYASGWGRGSGESLKVA